MAVLDLDEGHAPDPFRYSDYNLQSPSFLDRVEVSLRHGVYRPNQPLELTFPKSEFAVRPGRRIELEDLVVLYYCLNEISGDLEDKLKAGVTAYRIRRGNPPRVVHGTSLILPRYLRKRMRIVDPWYNAWPKFIRRLRTEYSTRGRRFVGTSDITSFYEDVDLRLLRVGLSGRVRRGTLPFVNLLVELYEGWSTRDMYLTRQNRGLPQGTASSGVVANYFLMPFDDELHRYAGSRNLRWYRYNDDMRLLGSDRENVRRGLRVVGLQLGRLNLIQQGSKTNILEGARARCELFEYRTGKVSTLITKIQRRRLTKRSRNSILKRLDGILQTVGDAKEKRDSTVLAMLYAAYREIGSDKLLPRWRKDYLREPTRAHTILSYVSKFLDRPGQCVAVARLLEQVRRTATDWELAEILRIFRRMRCCPREISQVLQRLSESVTANWYVRQQAILTLGWFSLTNEVKRLSRIFDTEWNDEVRRAILTVLFLLPTDDERLFLRRASRDLSPKVSRMANFLLKLRADPSLAQPLMRQFYGPNESFFGDNFWKLYQFRWITHIPTRSMARRIVQKSKRVFHGRYAGKHLKALESAIQ